MFGRSDRSASVGVEILKDKRSALKKVAEIILLSEKELFINSNYYLKMFEEELKVAKEKGVRIVFFSFNVPEKIDVEMEIFMKGIAREDTYNRHISIVADHEYALLYDELLESKKVDSLFISHPSLVRMIGEHIHHDIYFQKIQYLIGGMNIVSKVNIKSSYEMI